MSEENTIRTRSMFQQEMSDKVNGSATEILNTVKRKVNSLEYKLHSYYDSVVNRSKFMDLATHSVIINDAIEHWRAMFPNKKPFIITRIVEYDGEFREKRDLIRNKEMSGIDYNKNKIDSMKITEVTVEEIKHVKSKKPKTINIISNEQKTISEIKTVLCVKDEFPEVICQYDKEFDVLDMGRRLNELREGINSLNKDLKKANEDITKLSYLNPNSEIGKLRMENETLKIVIKSFDPIHDNLRKLKTEAGYRQRNLEGKLRKLREGRKKLDDYLEEKTRKSNERCERIGETIIAERNRKENRIRVDKWFMDVKKKNEVKSVTTENKSENKVENKTEIDTLNMNRNKSSKQSDLGFEFPPNINMLPEDHEILVPKPGVKIDYIDENSDDNSANESEIEYDDFDF